jgi:mRNA-degrading endonuclease HigB of HigAB toxin-antitoxin module
MQMHKASAEELKAWKAELANAILANPSSIVSYYIINKYIGETPLYNPLDKEDLKMISAVANAYNTFKPTDPRTAYLVNVAISNRRRVAPVQGDTMVATEIPLLDLTLQDENGKMRQLSEVASQGKVVVLNFTVYADELSPAFNAVLLDEYKKYNKKGLEIYQIAYDYDEFQWRQAAMNLPWVTVLDSDGVNSKNLMMYNVGSLPAIFILNRKGEIVERVFEIESLSKVIAKYM